MFTNETIPDSPLFAGIQPEEKESILKCLSAVEKKYEKGDAVFLAGTEIHSMGFVLSGSVEISRDDFWGNRQVLGHAGSGELFGEAYACMPGEALMVNVEAAEKSQEDLECLHTGLFPPQSPDPQSSIYYGEEKSHADEKDRTHGTAVHPGKGDGVSLLRIGETEKADVYDPLQPSAARRLPCGGPKCLVCGTFQDEKGRADPV